MNRNDKNPAMREGVSLGPCIGLIELNSVARGIEVTDAILWDAEVEALCATPVQPGKYVMLFTGPVEDVRSGMRRGEEVAGSDVVDRLVIPQVDEQVERALRREGGHMKGELDSIGVVEVTTVAAAVMAADIALKASTVDLLDLRIANGLGGKSYFTLHGEVSDVRSAVSAASESAEVQGLLARQVVIPRPHPGLALHL